MRILWASNAPFTKTGYGTQTKYAVKMLQDAGHQLAVFAYYGLQNALWDLDGVLVYPAGNTPWGNDILEGHAQHFKADVVISLMDVWVQHHWGKKATNGGWAFCPWLPIDMAPAPSMVVERLEGAHTVLPYSKFGDRELLKAGVENTWYIPHAIDCYQTYLPGNKADARQAMKLPEDRFIVGIVGTNKGYPARKCLAEQILAFSQFRARHPDALLYLHTLISRAQEGIDIGMLLKNLGLEVGKDVIYTNQYEYVVGWPEAFMVSLYQAFDVLSCTSMGEGFGLPILEAQACGCPVVLANNTTSPELLFAGAMVEKVHSWWTPLNAWAYIPDVDGIVDAYEEMYDRLKDPAGAEEMQQSARAGALDYDISEVRDVYWLPFLQYLAQDLGLTEE